MNSTPISPSPNHPLPNPNPNPTPTPNETYNSTSTITKSLNSIFSEPKFSKLDKEEFSEGLMALSLAYKEASKTPDKPNSPIQTPQDLATLQKLLNNALLREYSTLTSQALSSLLDDIQANFTLLNSQGTLVTLVQHQEAWVELAKALASTTQNPSSSFEIPTLPAIDITKIAAILRIVLTILELLMGNFPTSSP